MASRQVPNGFRIRIELEIDQGGGGGIQAGSEWIPQFSLRNFHYFCKVFLIFESRFEVDFGANFAPFWYRFGIIVEVLEGFGRLLGALGRLLDRLGRVLGAVWRVLGASSARQIETRSGRAES